MVYGVLVDGMRLLLTYTMNAGESQTAWDGLLHDLYRRGLDGRHLQLIVTDGWPGCERPCRQPASG